MECISCRSTRIINVSGKSRDMNFVLCLADNYKSEGYVPDGLNIGSGDYIEFEYCANCGQIQGEFPIKHLGSY